MAGLVEKFLKVVPFNRAKPRGSAQTNTYSPDQTDQVLTKPTYDQHRKDLFAERAADNSADLLRKLFIHDPDVSAAVNAFLTTADTEPVFMVRDKDGKFDRKGQQELQKILAFLTTRFDYSKGFQIKPSIRAMNEAMRYMLLLRGGIAEELVFDKNQVPAEVRHVDLQTIEWFEKEPNRYIPQQRAPGSNEEISLDVPTFFVAFFRRDPTNIYTHSPFVSSINTVAARQQVINDLYRIMQTTGFPRMEAKILEEVIVKNAPQDIRQDKTKLQNYIQQQISQIQGTLANTRADQAIVHTDAVEISMFNEKNPSNGLDISSVITALNAMNQAGLRSMATILGRGESGVNTASVEARIFTMNAEALNEPISDIWSQMMTMALRVVTKTESRVDVKFRPAELRPLTELEPQLNLRAARLRQDLSDGIIDDDEYHLEMYGRIRPDDAPELSGTGFISGGGGVVDAEEVSPNSDPLGRSLTPEGGDATKGSNVTKKDPNA